jgi:hypothetical protein
MPDRPKLNEPFAVSEIWLDGFFSDARLDGETFRCTAFSMQSVPGTEGSHPVAVVRLGMTVKAARLFRDQLSEVLVGFVAKPVAHERRRPK